MATAGTCANKIYTTTDANCAGKVAAYLQCALSTPIGGADPAATAANTAYCKAAIACNAAEYGPQSQCESDWAEAQRKAVAVSESCKAASVSVPQCMAKAGRCREGLFADPDKSCFSDLVTHNECVAVDAGAPDAGE
jgi:hypothetical protein